MSAEELLNEDIQLVNKAPEKEKPNYFDLMSLRIEAAARLSRAIKTLRDAGVIKSDTGTGLQEALNVAEQYWAEICMGLTPVDRTMRDNLPACTEAFRVVVMEHAQREALERECRNMIDHAGGFKLLTQPQVLHLEQKHVCDGNCEHDSKTL